MRARGHAAIWAWLMMAVGGSAIAAPAPMQGGGPPPDARNPDYSGGYRYEAMAGLDMEDDPLVGMLLLDRLEIVHSRDGRNGLAVDGEASYGRNLDKLWLKFEGDGVGGALDDLRTEALWDHAITPFWDAQAGLRHDFGRGPGRTWVALGVEGLAPYWIRTEAALYVGEGGRTAARVQVEYDALLTQRLILQPRLETNLYGKADPERGIGSGLSDLEAGLRLRYAIRRDFAPYLGVAWRQRFGRTHDLSRALGERPAGLEVVAGIHARF